jgi:hypothetical protein
MGQILLKKYSFYYDSKQVLRFVFIEGGAVVGSVMEHRIYLNTDGKRIWEIQKYLKGPVGYWKKIWPDESLIYNPWKEFHSTG